jgi:adenosylcobinamide-phosphate synthase
MILSSALLVAFAIDALWGEPKARWHPVVWMGQYLSFTGTRCAPLVAHNSARAHGREFARGMWFWCLGALVCVLFAVGVQQLAAELPSWAAIALLAVTLKPLFAWRMLVQEVQAVEAALNQSLAAGRERLALLCSRDVSQLNDAQVRETALETSAENLNDSLVAPLFWFVLLGMPRRCALSICQHRRRHVGLQRRAIRPRLDMGRQVCCSRRRCTVLVACTHHSSLVGGVCRRRYFLPKFTP